jgi:ubiquinone/menaquinone biosynthesis C-methylase UbiE
VTFPISSHRFFAEETQRRKWNDPEETLKNIGLRLGMVFMDIGCGEGFFTIPAAQIVGETGQVYGVDVEAASIDNLKRKAVEKGLKNLKLTVGAAEKTVFCKECADIVFYSIVLHDFDDPIIVLKNGKEMLKQSGKIVNLDWKKQSMPFGPPVQIRFSEEKASALIEKAGFKVESVRDSGPYQYLIIGRP